MPEDVTPRRPPLEAVIHNHSRLSFPPGKPHAAPRLADSQLDEASRANRYLAAAGLLLALYFTIDLDIFTLLISPAGDPDSVVGPAGRGLDGLDA